MTSSRYGRDVEEVLNSATALDAFREWIRIDPNRSEEVPDLYFALKGFKNYLRSHDAPIRAQMIHRKYISLKTGTCEFIPSEVRQEMSNRIHGLKSNGPVSSTLFDPVWNPLLALLRGWHTHFICSEPYNMLLAKEMDDMNEGYTEVLSTTEFVRKQRKPRYSCDASTSKALVDVDKLDGYADKVPNSTYRHEKDDERIRFVRDISDKLQKIADDIERMGGDVYARDLPKASQESFSSFKEKVLEETASDEELSKYADKIGRRRSTSESPPLNNASFTPLHSTLAPIVPGYDFNVPIPERFTLQRPVSKARTPGFYDTSGFCSSESAYFSSERSYGQRSSGFNEGSFQRASPFQAHTLQRRTPAASLPAHNVFATLPRKMSQPKVECRLWRDGEVAPYSAKVPGTVITLHQFRRTFGIRRSENLRLLFKSPCDDNSAPFQWSLISDDEQTLPVFEGRITAEARVYVDSD